MSVGSSRVRRPKVLPQAAGGHTTAAAGNKSWRCGVMAEGRVDVTGGASWAKKKEKAKTFREKETSQSVKMETSISIYSLKRSYACTSTAVDLPNIVYHVAPAVHKKERHPPPPTPFSPVPSLLSQETESKTSLSALSGVWCHWCHVCCYENTF